MSEETQPTVTTPDPQDAAARIRDLRRDVLAGKDVPPDVLSDALQRLRVAWEAQAMQPKPKTPRKRKKEEPTDA